MTLGTACAAARSDSGCLEIKPARMAAAELIRVEKQGVTRYHRLTAPAVAQMVESIVQIASGLKAGRSPVVTGPRDVTLRVARSLAWRLPTPR